MVEKVVVIAGTKGVSLVITTFSSSSNLFLMISVPFNGSSQVEKVEISHLLLR